VELVMGLFELAFFGNVLWIIAGLPTLVVLCAVTIFGGALARRTSRRAEGVVLSAERSTPTRFARPARVLALSLVGLGCSLGVFGMGAVLIASPEGAWGTVFGWMMTAGMTLMNVMMLVLFVLLVLVARDVVRRRFVAGRDTWFAYTLMIVAQTGVIVLAWASGVPGQLLGPMY
jgi:hypothetical protein